MKLTSSLALGAFTALCLAAVPACDDKKADAKGDAKKDDKKADAKGDAKEDAKGEAKEDAKAGEDAPADGGAEADAAGDAGATKVGIALCDEYVEKYSKCIDEHAPEATKSALRDGVAKNAERWKKELEGPGKDSVEKACEAALASVKKTSTNWGCTY